MLTFLIVLAVLAVTFLVFVKTSSNPVAKFLSKKIFGNPNKFKKKKLDCVVLSGPSGVGKGTIIEKLKSEYPGGFAFSVSHTTRAPRDGETDGKEYHFTTKEKFEAMIAADEFIEYAQVHGNYYGTSKAALQAVTQTGAVALVEIDVQGAKKLKSKISSTTLSCIFLFLKAPSLDELRSRITKRGKETPEKIEIRLKTAEEELKFIEQNESLYDRVIVNKDLDETYGRVKRVLSHYGGLTA